LSERKKIWRVRSATYLKRGWMKYAVKLKSRKLTHFKPKACLPFLWIGKTHFRSQYLLWMLRKAQIYLCLLSLLEPTSPPQLLLQVYLRLKLNGLSDLNSKFWVLKPKLICLIRSKMRLQTNQRLKRHGKSKTHSKARQRPQNKVLIMAYKIL
jgi:hypothetical protein